MSNVKEKMWCSPVSYVRVETIHRSCTDFIIYTCTYVYRDMGIYIYDQIPNISKTLNNLFCGSDEGSLLSMDCIC